MPDFASHCIWQQLCGGYQYSFDYFSPLNKQVSPLNHPRESGHKNFISTLRKYVRKTVSMSLTIRLAGPLHHGAQHSIRMEMNQGTFVIASPSFR